MLNKRRHDFCPGVQRADAPFHLGSRGSNDDGNTGVDDDTQVMEPDQGNVLSHLISQLRPGADLSRVTLPTFILEPRSMLERITKYKLITPHGKSNLLILTIVCKASCATPNYSYPFPTSMIPSKDLYPW